MGTSKTKLKEQQELKNQSLSRAERRRKAKQENKNPQQNSFQLNITEDMLMRTNVYLNKRKITKLLNRNTNVFHCHCGNMLLVKKNKRNGSKSVFCPECGIKAKANSLSRLVENYIIAIWPYVEHDLNEQIMQILDGAMADEKAHINLKNLPGFNINHGEQHNNMRLMLKPATDEGYLKQDDNDKFIYSITNEGKWFFEKNKIKYSSGLGGNS